MLQPQQKTEDSEQHPQGNEKIQRVELRLQNHMAGMNQGNYLRVAIAERPLVRERRTWPEQQVQKQEQQEKYTQDTRSFQVWQKELAFMKRVTLIIK